MRLLLLIVLFSSGAISFPASRSILPPRIRPHAVFNSRSNFLLPNFARTRGPLSGSYGRQATTQLITMQSRKAVCGLWSFRYEIEGLVQEVNVWLEECGSMRPVSVKKPDEEPSDQQHLLSAGRWSVKQSSVTLYHRKMGEPSHSWMGQLREEQRGPETANLSRRYFCNCIVSCVRVLIESEGKGVRQGEASARRSCVSAYERVRARAGGCRCRRRYLCLCL